MNTCPAFDRLQALIDDQLSSPEVQAVEAHVETCVGCQQALEQLTDSAANHKGKGVPSHGESGNDFLRRLEQKPPAGAWVFRENEQETRDIGEPNGVPKPQRPDWVKGPHHGWNHKPDGPRERIKMTLVPGSGPQSAVGIKDLLRRRLLFFGTVSWTAFAVYAVLCVVLYPEAFALLLYVVVLATTGVLTVLLRSRRALSLPQLRWVEAALFASLALFFSWLQCLFFSSGWLTRVAGADWLSVMLAARGMSVSWLILVMSYGLLIPNTWRRGAAFVGILALWPVLLNATQVLGDGWGEYGLLFVVESGLDMALGAALAIYGTHRIDTLRQQAAQARKLGQYRLKQLLGTGGMGEVYLGEHVLLKRPCAIKVIRPEHAGDPKNLLRFEREVQATATLTHPNTIEIFDYGHAAEGTFYYVMEYLSGLSLDELVQRQGPLTPPRVIHLLRQVCGALHEAHTIGLIHRDIKPANIFLCERGGVPDVAKLLDFGLVQTNVPEENGQRLTQEGTLAGTPAYMSPEQAASKADLDARSDLYSLGAVTYFLLTGQPPFVRKTAVQTLSAHLTELPALLTVHFPDMPSDVQAVVLRCLEKEPARRFQGADDLEEALAHCDCAGHWMRAQATAWWEEYFAANPQKVNQPAECLS